MWRVFFTDTCDGTQWDEEFPTEEWDEEFPTEEWDEEFPTEEAARNRARYPGEMVRAVIEDPKGRRVN